MAISEKSIKLLWSNAAGRCSFPGCGIRLTVNNALGVASHTLGEMAHVKGEKPGSSRYDKKQPSRKRDDYTNLILLCPNHHTMIDKKENLSVYTVGKILQMKERHELHIRQRLDENRKLSLEKIKRLIHTRLSENHLAWKTYGPLSEIARKNPHSEDIYALWKYERLSTIVPNNRLIVDVIEGCRSRFSIANQSVINEFLLHANSYEKWVNDKIPYSAVLRFPRDFEKFIMGDSDNARS
jgi:hypothetical protein